MAEGEIKGGDKPVAAKVQKDLPKLGNIGKEPRGLSISGNASLTGVHVDDLPGIDD